MKTCVLQVEVVQEGPVDAAERGAADERQMTPAADSLYGAVRRPQTVSAHDALHTILTRRGYLQHELS